MKIPSEINVNISRYDAHNGIESQRLRLNFSLPSMDWQPRSTYSSSPPRPVRVFVLLHTALNMENNTRHLQIPTNNIEQDTGRPLRGYKSVQHRRMPWTSSERTISSIWESLLFQLSLYSEYPCELVFHSIPYSYVLMPVAKETRR